MNFFKAMKISEQVYWVGAIDWELRNFHGYATSRGTTYNAFLILGEQPILIDTVKKPFFNEMLERIKSVIAPEKIRYIISNHAEMDHSGCLPEMIDLINPEKIFASTAGAQALNSHFHWQNKITEIQDGEMVDLAGSKIKFIDTKMLHWPDSMMTYFVNDKILFSQDGFGMHFATNKLLVAENDFGVVSYETAKYFANILLPYCPFVTRLGSRLTQLNLAISTIAPDHGPLWHGDNINWVLAAWQRFAKQDYYPKAVIIYDTMWNSTAAMANSIADGITNAGIAVKVMNLSVNSRSDVITEILEAGALLVGSPTLNQEIFPTVADNLCYIRGLKPKNLLGQAFGSYGWGAEAQKILTEELQRLGVVLVGEGIKTKYVPTPEILQQCWQLGQEVAKSLKQKL